MAKSKALPALLQARCSETTRERAELAAAECELSLGEWIRAVIEGALAVHFDEDEVATDEPAPSDVPDPAEDPEGYMARVEADARQYRDHELVTAAPAVLHPGVAADEAEPGTTSAPRSPRDCPHLPQWRVAGRCSTGQGGCGGTIPTGRPLGVGFRQ